MSTSSSRPSGPLAPAHHYRGDHRCMSEDNAGYLIKQVHNSLTRTIDREMAPLDLTATQWRPMAMLAMGRAGTPAELARQAGVDTGAMTRTLDRLEAKGLLRRVRSQEDRRVVKLELTDMGRHTAHGIAPVIARVLNHHLRGFSTDEVSLLSHFLHRMIANGSAPIQEK